MSLMLELHRKAAFEIFYLERELEKIMLIEKRSELQNKLNDALERYEHILQN